MSRVVKNMTKCYKCCKKLEDKHLIRVDIFKFRFSKHGFPILSNKNISVCDKCKNNSLHKSIDDCKLFLRELVKLSWECPPLKDWIKYTTSLYSHNEYKTVCCSICKHKFKYKESYYLCSNYKNYIDMVKNNREKCYTICCEQCINDFQKNNLLKFINKYI